MKIGEYIQYIEDNFSDNDGIYTTCSSEVAELLFNTYIGHDGMGCDKHYYQIQDNLIQNENR